MDVFAGSFVFKSMKVPAVVLLFVAAFVSDSISAQSCTGRPDEGQFYLAAPKCDAAAPCLPGRTLAFNLSKQTGCYPPWAPCPGYVIQACDTIEWSFGDGTTATATGVSSMSHRWSSSGWYAVRARVTNPNGSAAVGVGVLIAAEPIAYLKFAESTFTAAETAGHVDVVLRRTGDTTRRMTVEYRTGFSIGTIDRNLEVVEGSVTFGPGDATKTFSIPVVDDHVYNGDSDHSIWIGCTSGDAILPRVIDGYADIRIVEDEPAPTATVARNVRVPEGDQGSTMLKIPVTLSRPFPESAGMWWTIWEETATMGVDWAPAERFMSGSLNIPAGETRGELSVQILGDTKVEGDETFRIDLIRSGAFAFVVVGAPTTVTIVNDDIAFSSDSELIAAGQTERLTLFTLAGPTPTSASVMSTDPAVVETPSTVAIAGGAMSTTFTVKGGRPGTAEVRATVAGSSSVASTRVTVYEPFVPTFDRGTVQVIERSSAAVSLRVAPPPVAPLRAVLTTSQPSVIHLPASVSVPVTGKATFTIEGLSPGTATITATLADSPGQPMATLAATVVARDAPVLQSVAPSAGSSTGGANVTLLGGNLRADCSVMFGDLFAVVSTRDASTIVAVAPPHPPGFVDVSIRCGAVRSSVSNAFEYLPAKRRAARK